MSTPQSHSEAACTAFLRILTGIVIQPAKTFLLIEDDPDDVFFVERAFKEAPSHLRLCHVGDARESIRYLKGEGDYADRRKYPLPNVILLDLKMPGLNGFDFLTWL